MKGFARVLLLWVMVLAMPLQGMAASLQAFCGPSHERMMQGLAPHDPAAPTARASDHPSPGHHGSAAVTGDGCDGAAGAGACPGAGHAGFSCSACAACCTMLAIPVHFTLPERSALAQSMPAATAAALTQPPPDGLDRPPRTHVA